MARRKKEDVTEYMQRAVALIHQDVPPNPATLQKVFQAGRTGVQILEPGRRGRLDFRDYLIPGERAGCRGEPHEQQDSWPAGGDLHRQSQKNP